MSTALWLRLKKSNKRKAAVDAAALFGMKVPVGCIQHCLPVTGRVVFVGRNVTTECAVLIFTFAPHTITTFLPC